MRSMKIDCVARGANQKLMGLLLKPDPLTAEEWEYVTACEDAVDQHLLSDDCDTEVLSWQRCATA